jgi:hypothetical protein
MSLITQIKAEQRKSAAKMNTAKKRLTKTETKARRAAADLQAAREAVKLEEAVQHKLEQQLKLEEGTPATGKGLQGHKKPGPKPKLTAKGKAGHKKPAKAAKKSAKAQPKGGAQASARAAEGRRQVAQKLRPPIKDLIAKVLGKRVMNSQEVYEAIKAKGQLPNSGDPRGYIGYLLSASKDKAGDPLFERVPTKGRGFYKNQGVTVKTGKPAKPVKAKAAPKKAAKATAKAKPVKAKAKPVKAKAAPKKAKCGATGHNARGHDKWAAGQKAGATKAAPKAKEPKAAKPAAPAKAAGEKKTVLCGKCKQPGHNAKGHDKWAASQKAGSNGTSGPAKSEPVKEEPKAETKPAATKPEAEKTTDEVLAEAGIDLGPAASA